MFVDLENDLKSEKFFVCVNFIDVLSNAGLLSEVKVLFVGRYYLNV